MKQNKPGRPTGKARYIGVKVVCSRCDYEGTIEDGDDITPGSQTDPADMVKCPNCGHMIDLPSQSSYNGPG